MPTVDRKTFMIYLYIHRQTSCCFQLLHFLTLKEKKKKNRPIIEYKEIYTHKHKSHRFTEWCVYFFLWQVFWCSKWEGLLIFWGLFNLECHACMYGLNLGIVVSFIYFVVLYVQVECYDTLNLWFLELY